MFYFVLLDSLRRCFKQSPLSALIFLNCHKNELSHCAHTTNPRSHLNLIYSPLWAVHFSNTWATSFGCPVVLWFQSSMNKPNFHLLGCNCARPGTFILYNVLYASAASIKASGAFVIMFPRWRNQGFKRLSSFQMLFGFKIGRNPQLFLKFGLFLCVCAQSCPTLCDPMDCSPPGSSVQGILQVRILECIAISFSRGFSWPRDWAWVSCIAGRLFTVWATREAPAKINCITENQPFKNFHVLMLKS